MKAKLIKHSEPDFYFIANNDGTTFATTDEWYFSKTKGCYKLSKQNCDEIFGIVTPESMMKDILSTCEKTKEGYILGFQMAMELNKDKVFTMEDINKAIQFGANNYEFHLEGRTERFIQSLQQPTEIDVEIESKIAIDGHAILGYELDSEGCLILKKI